MEDGRERDGVFVTEEFIHIVECTVSRAKRKASDDADKIAGLIRKYETAHRAKFIKGWFVTLDEPTAEQRAVVEKRKERIVAVSYDQLRSRLVDARTYLQLRGDYPFGSVRDPETGSPRVRVDYLPLDILDGQGGAVPVVDLPEMLDAGQRFVLLGDYGAGKSSTLAELFRRTAKMFWDAKSLKFPVLINLRDHHGQTSPVEALERHARNVGFSNPSHLVRAWRAGYAILMLDGFDEIATAGWAGKTKKLRDLRYRSMELIRNLIRESASGGGLLVAGRQHFFDNDAELSSSLGLSPLFRRLYLSEFSPEQVVEYLRRMGWVDAVPEWLPSRPLLLGYLAARGLLGDTLAAEAGSSPAVGWDGLLGRVSEREAEIEAGIDAGTVRRLIEHLATVARASSDGLGPVSSLQIVEAFQSACGYAPDDRGAVLLQRLPGLGGHNSDDGARAFVDRDLAAAATAGDVVRYVEDPYSYTIDSSTWQTALVPLGAEIAALRCSQKGFSASQVSAALERAAAAADQGALAADIFLILQKSGAGYAGPKRYVREAIIPQMSVSSDSCGSGEIEFQDCIVLVFDYESEAPIECVPRFVRCYFTRVDGSVEISPLHIHCFENCEFEEFERPAETTKALMGLSIPLGGRVLLSALKKLYAQSGKGRRESALFRGLDLRARECVPQVLDLLRREGFAIRTRAGDHVVWLPSREGEIRQRALKMLASPSASRDPLLRSASSL